MYIVSSISVYEASVESPVLAGAQAQWESPQMFGELCAQLWMVSQSVAEITKGVQKLAITKSVIVFQRGRVAHFILSSFI